MAASRTPSPVAGDQLNCDLTLDQPGRVKNHANRIIVLMLQHLINHKDRRGIRQFLCTHQSLLCSVNPDMHGNIESNSNPETAANPDRVFQLTWKLGVVESGA